MNRVARFVSAGLLVLGGMGSAVAADMAVKAPPPAPIMAAEYNWSGFYAGVNGGWSSENMFWAYDPPVAGGVRQTNSYNWNTGVLGGHIGAQYQFGHIVLGVEGGYIWNNASWQGFSCPNASLVCQARMNDIWTVGGRAGYAWDRVLVYGTGGYAQANINTQVGPALGVGLVEFSGVRQDGWFGGVGVEYAAYRGQVADLILGLEYTHIELDRAFHCVVSPGGTCNIPSTVNRDLDGHADMVRARLSIKFNPWQAGPVVAKY